MFVKLTSGFTGAVLLFRKLVLRDFWRTGSKSCKPEVTFAIYPLYFIIAETQCNCKRIDANARLLKHILLLYLRTASPLFSIEPSNIIESSGEI